MAQSMVGTCLVLIGEKYIPKEWNMLASGMLTMVQITLGDVGMPCHFDIP
jgi:hypothetical protein